MIIATVSPSQSFTVPEDGFIRLATSEQPEDGWYPKMYYKLNGYAINFNLGGTYMNLPAARGNYYFNGYVKKGDVVSWDYGTNGASSGQVTFYPYR